MLLDNTLRKELARSFGATVIVLVTIVMTMTLIRTLGRAAVGGIDPSEVGLITAFALMRQIPLILNLALFIAVVSTLSRMYLDSEMVIWQSSGINLMQLIAPVLRFAWPVFLGVALIAQFVQPWSHQQMDLLRERYEKRSDIDRVEPGQFQESANGRRVFFVDKESATQQARNVFIYTHEHGIESFTTAKSGRLMQADDGSRHLVLDNGMRVEFKAQQQELRTSEFAQLSVQVSEALTGDASPSAKSLHTLALIQSPTLANLGELSWRMGLTFAPLNLVLLGLVVTRANPRVGRSGNLMLAVLIYAVYANMATLGQSWITQGRAGFMPWVTGVHGGTLVLALIALWWRAEGPPWRAWRRRVTAVEA